MGFRYTTTEVAQRFAVAGYVQNLADGRVCVVAEGATSEVGAFVEALFERMSRFIDTHQVDETVATGEFGPPDAQDTFTVRY